MNYLIPGVPYNGIYNLLFREAAMSNIASTMDILGYWGDERFSVSDLKNKFFPTSTSSLPYTPKHFFEENGYQTYNWLTTQPGNEIREIKKFVNPDKKIPVMVFQRRSLDPKIPEIIDAKVVIGIFDNEKKVIVHDFLLGNNYEISYDDFEKMFPNGNGRVTILAVWPSDKINGLIKGPDYNIPYPQRLEAMDKLGNSLEPFTSVYLPSEDGNSISYRLTSAAAPEQVLIFCKDITDDPNFKYFPRQFQVYFFSALARQYITLNQLDEAIRVLKENVLPLNENLNETLGKGWYIVPVDKLSTPYFLLSLAYLRKGENKLALENYKEFMQLRDANGPKINDASIVPPRLEELEKLIPPKK